MRTADWIISETGLQNLMSAGIAIAWLQAWVKSAGATVVRVHLLESNTWQDLPSDWQLFFASVDELNKLAAAHCAGLKNTLLKLDNPPRNVRAYTQGDKKTLLLPVGDIAYQRHIYLSFLNNARELSPLYVYPNSSMPIMLETGVSADLIQPAKAHYLNAAGLLIEEQVIAALQYHQLSIRTVESCTGGAIAARLCRMPGASTVMDRAWVTYSDAAKEQEVGVAKALIDQYGAVSQAVAIAMAEGGATADQACIAVTGVAGPGGGTEEKPVGTVCIAVALKATETQSRCLNMTGARHEIQQYTVIAALHLLLEMVEESH